MESVATNLLVHVYSCFRVDTDLPDLLLCVQYSCVASGQSWMVVGRPGCTAEGQFKKAILPEEMLPD